MLGIRSLISSAVRAKTLLTRVHHAPNWVMHKAHHDHGPPQPFDNLPFTINSRAAATFFFVVFFGVGYWAPFLIVWYSMAKRTM